MTPHVSPCERLPADPVAEGAPSGRGVRRRAFTLTEVMVVLVVLAILASLLVQQWNPGLVERLEAGGAAVAADLAYVRGLAVSQATTYEVVADVSGDSFEVQGVAGDGSRFLVPAPAFLPSPDSSRFIEDLSRLPSGPVELVTVQISGPPQQGPPTFRFLPTGTVDPPDGVRIWLAVGQGDGRWYLTVDIDGATGRATVGQVQREGPVQSPSAQASATAY